MNTKIKALIIGVIVIGISLGIHFWNNRNNSFKTSKSNEEVGVVSKEKSVERKIMTTNGVRHSVSLDEIFEGGPKKDGIPSIDNPKFISVREASDFMEDEDIGIAIEVGETVRFYPYKILVRHEIVNDIIGGERILITYCPLCLSGVVYDPIVGGERVQFGTSGKLWNSNLVMYDRKTESYWSQVLGEAIKGEMTGEKLPLLPSDAVRFGNWKSENSTGEVLSRDTGLGLRSSLYNSDPYIQGGFNYYLTEDIFFPTSNEDNRLANKDFVLGVIINGKAKAYVPSAVKSIGELEDEIGGVKIVARYEDGLDTVRFFEKKLNGTLERINPMTSFWFAWVAVYPDTELYK
jgi:hypothetical protein